MKCCGSELETPFCPDCGKENCGVAYPLKGLLRYLRTNEKAAQKNIESLEKWINSPGCQLSDFDRKRKLHLRQKTYDRWKRWADSLDKLTSKEPPC